MNRKSPGFHPWSIALAGSILVHVLAMGMFLLIMGPPKSPFWETEVEWTWTAPETGKDSVPKHNNTRMTAGPAELQNHPVPTPASAAAAGGDETKSPTLTDAAGEKPATAENKTKTGTVEATSGISAGTGQLEKRASTEKRPPSSTQSTASVLSSEDPMRGVSTGYALVPPRIRDRMPVQLPGTFTPAGWSGNVLLVVEVLEDGQVGKIIIRRSSGVKAADEAARESVAHWRFEPAWQPQENKPVRVMTAVWVCYAQEGR